MSIGFVSHNWGAAGHLVYENWVRFAEIRVGGTPGMRKLGSFCIIGGWWDFSYVGIGFVSHNWGRDGLKLGSFCIIGENPEVRMQNSGDEWPALARVLSDGGWLDTVFNSPCFRCKCIPH